LKLVFNHQFLKKKMDLQSFIQSGLLELYAAGQCSDEERTLVEQMAARHSSVRIELDAIEQALEQYTFAQAVVPPPSLKNDLLDRLSEPRPAVPSAGVTKSAAASASLRLFQVLTGLLALASIALFWQFNKAQSTQKTSNEKIAALEKQVTDCAQQQQKAEKMRQQIVLLRDRDTKTYELSNGKSATYVYHNTVRGETGLDLGGLQAPQAGKYYQFWAIVEGKPVSMGMVQLQASGGWQELPYLANAETFAISAETNPNGNATPTEVVMIGKPI
jgi:anti-sigma-K factor RskA